VCVATQVDGVGILRRGGCATPNFFEYNPEQAYLLAPGVRDVLGEDHLCFFVHRAVEELDFVPIYFSHYTIWLLFVKYNYNWSICCQMEI
jgi:hypothetical protein